MKKPSLKKRKKQVVETPTRITNETVAEHREQILAGGRKFKYPHQYERHRLVFNVLIISVVTLVILAAVSWWQLYPMQNTSTFFYRVTRIVPVPVATVDGAQVRYSDYLMTLNGSLHYLEQSERLNLATEDGKRQTEYVKRQALDGAIADAYAAKLAKEEGITVTDNEIDEVIDSSLNTVSGRISQDVYDDSTFSTLGYTADEYRHIIERSLIRQKVSYHIDKKANTAKQAAVALMDKNRKQNLGEVAKALQDQGYTNVQVGSSGLVPITNHDGGLTQMAANLTVGDRSNFMRSTTGDGYYLVELTKLDDKQLSYNFIKIPLTAFDNQLESLAKNNKVTEYIDVNETDNQLTNREQ
jgi:hypothetical protein